MSTALLELHNVHKRFGGVQAVRAVDLTLSTTTILGLIGPNGAGKTTLVNMISGTLLPSQGEIHFNQQRITRLRPEHRCRLGMMRTFQNLSLFGDMSTVENVALGANAWYRGGLRDLFTLRRLRETQLYEEALSHLQTVGLKAQAAASPSALSYGNQRKLEIARALMGRPRLLLLDEPAAGLNNRESQELAELILDLRRSQHLGIVLIEHDMDVLMAVSDTVVVLDQGAVLTRGAPRQVQRDPRVIEAYLGQDDIFDDLADG